MQFEDKDFESLSFPVHSIPNDIDVLEQYPVLKLYEEFKCSVVPLNKTKIFKYVVYLYDSQTPLKSIENFNQRKVEAAKLADFPLEQDSDWYQEHIDILSGRNNRINQIILRYCRLMRSEDYSQLLIYEGFFYDSLLKLQEGGDLDAQEHSRVLANIDKAKKTLTDLKKSFLQNDTNANINRIVMDSIENDSLGLSPEAIAIKLSGGVGIIDILGIDPYDLKGRNIKIRNNNRL